MSLRRSQPRESACKWPTKIDWKFELMLFFRRDVDIIMLTCFNGAVRKDSELEQIIKRADERYVIERSGHAKQGEMAVVEVSWSG